MSHWPFRFVHAADLHLESPPFGVTETPDHLREVFLECPYLAAERVFEAALAEEADFLILAGDVLHPLRTGPRGPLFLVEQFQRLEERGIPVYWAGGKVDSDEFWPAAVERPKNVHVFPAGRPEAQLYHRDGVPLVRLIGSSRARGRKVRASEFEPDPGGLYSIAVVHGNADAESLRSRPIDNWAQGGSHARNTLFSSPRVAHYPGTTQGRNPLQAGPHGCTLVQVDEERRVRTTLIPCDTLRWQDERIAVEPSTTRADLENRLNARMNTLRESLAGIDLFVSWSVAGSGPLLGQLRRGKLAAELLELLRIEHGTSSPAAWSVSLTPEPMAALPPEWYEQDTIRGDFLRELRRLQMNPEASIKLNEYLSAEHATGPLAGLAEVTDAAARDRVLREAAMLGVDLLTGEEP